MDQLAINEQFSFSNGNSVIDALSERGGRQKTFSETIALLFNRGGEKIGDEDRTIQILLLKFLLFILRNKNTSQFFYTNDLKVVMDAAIREVNNLPEDEEMVKKKSLYIILILLS